MGIEKGSWLSLASAALVATLGSDARAEGGVVGAIEADRMRISEHLARVEAALRAVPPPSDPRLRDERARNLDRVHEYRLRGSFPVNGGDHQRVPIFLDDQGTACAVAYLVLESGHREIAESIRRRENEARLGAMTEPALPGWVAASGLTADECARIQPSYCTCSETYAPVCGVDGRTYGNRCVATECREVKIAHDGECKEDDGGAAQEWPGLSDAASNESPKPAKAMESGCSLARGSTDSARGDVLTLLALALLALRRRR